MGDQHPDAKPAAKGSIEKGRHCLLISDVLPAVTEPLRQGCHHVLVVLHQSSGVQVLNITLGSHFSIDY